MSDSNGERPSRRLFVVLGLVVLALGVAGYLSTGVPDYAQQAERARAEEAAAAAAAAQQMPDAQQLQAMAQQIETHLKSRPDDSEGWTMLGRVRSLAGEVDAAVAAYAKAISLGAGDARVLTDYAEVLGAKNGRSLRGEPTALLQRALVLDPDHPKALALAGAAAFDREDWPAAVGHWERLVKLSASDAGYIAQVQQGIAQARERMGPAAQPAAPKPVAQASAPAAAAAAATAASLGGTVRLAPALASKAGPEDTVFIIARAAEGPRMPLAILRKQVKDLPISFTLDDSMAMSPAMKLSAFPQVVVTARISKSGQALVQPGDLVGELPAQALGSRNLALTIDRVVDKP